jgi:hypothetical protein
VSEDLYSGERKHCCSAYFVFVTLKGKDGSKVQFPETYAETDYDQARLAMANERRAMRGTHQKKLDEHVRRASEMPVSPTMLQHKKFSNLALVNYTLYIS